MIWRTKLQLDYRDFSYHCLTDDDKLCLLFPCIASPRGYETLLNKAHLQFNATGAYGENKIVLHSLYYNCNK